MTTDHVGYVDTTLRDLVAHPWGVTISTEEIVHVTGALTTTGAEVLEVLDAFSARGAIEGRGDSPWDRLRVMVEAAAGVPVGIVLPSRTLFGSQPLSADLMKRLVGVAIESGVSRVRVIDPLNDVANLSQVAEAVVAAGGEVVPTLELGPTPAPDDERWIAEAREMAQIAGTSSLCVMDRAGRLRPTEMRALIPALSEATRLPLELAVTCPGALAPVASIAGIEAGAARVQAAVGSVALAAARPSVETIRAALAGSGRDLRCDREQINVASEVVWPLVPPDRLRQAQAVESGHAVGLPLDMAAGLASRLTRLGHLDKLVAAADEVAQVAVDCGNVTLTHPIGQEVVGQAIDHVVGDGERWAHISETLARIIRGDYGALRGPVAPAAQRAADAAKVGAAPEPLDMQSARAAAPEGLSEEDVLLWTMFPGGTERLLERRKSLVGEAADPMSSLDRGLIETLVDVVERSGQTEVTVEIGGARVTVRRSGASAFVPAPAPVVSDAPAAPAPAAASAPVGGATVESPIVGTFYAAASPDAPPFVSVGDTVAVGQTLCIIEAMKIFNEIVAEQAGTIAQIHVQNAEPVEYGTVLFTITP